MPELRDVVVYIESLARRIVVRQILKARILSPFQVRSFHPSVQAMEGKQVRCVLRMGKRMVLALGSVWGATALARRERTAAKI